MRCYNEYTFKIYLDTPRATLSVFFSKDLPIFFSCFFMDNQNITSGVKLKFNFYIVHFYVHKLTFLTFNFTSW